jgi:hypothetical protein
MSKRSGWQSSRTRDRMWRNGSVNARDHSPFMAPLIPHRRPKQRIPKNELRAAAQLAFDEWQTTHGSKPR